MEHLTTDTLARLVDEPPTRDERTHLDACPLCMTELDAIRAMTRSLGELPDVRPPRGDWEVLEAQLVSEGLIRVEGRVRSRLATTPGWMRVAAGLVLFLGGTGLGMTFDAGDARNPVPGALRAADGSLMLAAASPQTVAEAAETMRQAERIFIDALVQYRQMVDAEGSDGSGVDPERRYAALEYFLAAGEAAVREAPADPFMNGLLASVRAERQAARAEAFRQASRTQDWY